MKYAAGVITGIFLTLGIAVLISPKQEDLLNTWDG